MPNTVMQAQINGNSYIDVCKKPIEFVEVPSPQFLTRGQEGFISCEVTGNPTPTIHWKFNHITHINDNEDYSIVDGGLVVNDVALHDAGTYTCRARVKKTGAVESKDIDVKVYEMPEFFQVPENKSGIEYSSVNLYCNAKGTPEPTLTWLFQGEELTDDEKYFIAQAKTRSRSLAQAKTRSRSLAQAKTRSRSLAQAKTRSRSLHRLIPDPGP
uniref:Fasciclin-2-like n=1 Tax=Saccoglossus kowalevskii TaxID=10224 RepID=A0ABM0MYA7_SACKO|nr:PREDICTED: fasciclin-2-like [Saccoglossus kowalevskii]